MDWYTRSLRVHPARHGKGRGAGNARQCFGGLFAPEAVLSSCRRRLNSGEPPLDCLGAGNACQIFGGLFAPSSRFVRPFSVFSFPGFAFKTNIPDLTFETNISPVPKLEKCLPQMRPRTSTHARPFRFSCDLGQFQKESQGRFFFDFRSTFPGRLMNVSLIAAPGRAVIPPCLF